MGIRDIGFPLGIVGNHLAGQAASWEPQRAYNWILTISGIGQDAPGGGAVLSALGRVGQTLGGIASSAVGGVAGALGGAAGNVVGALAGGSAAGGGTAIELALDAASLPTQFVEEIELPYLNEARYVAGRARYAAIPLVLKDMVDIGVATACKTWYEQVHNSSTFKVGLARNYKKTADMILIAPDGSLERTWRLHGCWPTEINYGQLDMNSNDIVKIEMNLRYDRAEALNF